ncbi:hypothetical protein ACMW09_001556 [Cronobacter malonaticus]
MSEISKVIASEIADFFAGFGGSGEPDIQNGEAQRLLTERVLSVLALRERAEPVYQLWSSGINQWVECDKGRYEAHAHVPAQRRVLYTSPPAPVVNSNVHRICKKCSASIVGYSVDGLCEDCYLAAPVVPKIDRKAICNKVHWLCARSPGATFYNAAEFALDEVMELLVTPAPAVAEPVSQSYKLPGKEQ